MKLFKGVLQIFDNGRGTLVVQKWPKKRGPSKDPLQRTRVAQFTQVAGWFKTAPNEEQLYYRENAANTPYLPRDMYEMACFGKVVQFIESSGLEYIGARVLNANLQQLLNQLSQVDGTMIVRSAGLWQSLIPGDAGTVLTSNGPLVAPEYLPAKAGGAAGGITYSNNASGGYTTGGNTVGLKLLATMDLEVIGLGSVSDSAIGGSYVFRAAKWDNVNSLLVGEIVSSEPVNTPLVSSPGFGAQLTSPLPVAAGDYFMLMCSRVDSGQDGTFPMPYAEEYYRGLGIYVDNGVAYHHCVDDTPTITSVWGGDGGGTPGISFTYDFAAPSS